MHIVRPTYFQPRAYRQAEAILSSPPGSRMTYCGRVVADDWPLDGEEFPPDTCRTCQVGYYADDLV